MRIRSNFRVGPKKPFESAFSLLDGVFEDFDRIFRPCCYINKAGDGIYQVEVPGFNKDNLTVELSEGVLTVRGNREVKNNYAGTSKLCKRLTVGDAEDIKAEVKDGILTLTVKQRECCSPKETIEVK